MRGLLRRKMLLFCGILLVTSCAPDRKGVLPVKEEAVRLMDREENAKASQILEDYLEKNPEDDEARKLLASSYMGMAGINIYVLFDAFQDLIFRKTLLERFKGKRESTEIVRPQPPVTPTASEKTKEIDRWVAAVDRLFQQVQVALIYLDRFPTLEESKWRYLESALEQLQKMKSPSADIFTYQAFIRVVYTKSYILNRVAKETDLGTREWACRIRLQNLREPLEFLTEHARGIYQDLDQAVEHGAKRLAKAQDKLHFLRDAVVAIETYNQTNQGLFYSEVENRVKEVFNCPTWDDKQALPESSDSLASGQG